MEMSGQGALPDASSSAALTSGDVLVETTRQGERLYVLQVPAELASLTLVEKMTESLCREMLTDELKCDAIVLSVTEAMSNALRHGQLCDAAAWMQIQYHRNDVVLKVCLIDSGSELPQSVIARYREHVVNMPATTELTETLPEGGWGINLILQGSSEVSYQRAAGLNHLTLCFALQA